VRRPTEEDPVADTLTVNPETRMLIDGELVDADSGKTFTNINPATEEAIGEVADASAAEMQRAIASSRRAFDETDWSTNHSFRKRCLEQLQEALDKEREELREQLILEVGCPRMITQGPQLDHPLDGALRYPIKLIDEFEWEVVLPDGLDIMGQPNVRRIWKERLR
jgi:aldehyde dehydrogenase (NAD+)